MNQILDGIRVLELTAVINGPYAGGLLAELGAEVIKVEPLDGEIQRRIAPMIKGQAFGYMQYNPNKKSITLNLKEEKAKKIFYQLAEKSDVILENNTPGVMERLKIGWEDIRKINPRIIYASTTGYGQSGPYRDYPAYDSLAQARGGIMSATGDRMDPPVKTGPSITDFLAGAHTALCILIALWQRQQSGEGQRVDIAMYDAAVPYLYEEIAWMMANGKQQERLGNAHRSLFPHNIYTTNDGHIFLLIESQQQWKCLADIVGLSDGYADHEKVKNDQGLRSKTESAIESWTSSLSKADAERYLMKNGIPCARVNYLDEVIADPLMNEHDMFVSVEQQIAGPIKIPGSCLNIQDNPGRVIAPGSPLGFHNEEILSTLLGYSSDEIANLKKAGVI